MASITIKDIPEELHRRLKAQAKANRRSLNAEVIACLESLVPPGQIAPEVVIAQAQALRESLDIYLTQEMIEEAIEDGRRY